MAARSEQLLVVLSVLEGRHFPRCPHLSLLVQAGFNGELLATDPTEHQQQPQFNTELCWELDRRTLHQHRLQRTPIKLQCISLDPVSGRKEGVGYVVMDLRCVQELPQEPRWYPLLSSKYTKRRPSLLLAAALENDTKTATMTSSQQQKQQQQHGRFRAKKAPPRTGSPSVSDLLPEHLEAVLVPEEGFHQVGPESLCREMFVLSVTLAFAHKLEQLIPSSTSLSSEGGAFFFYYSLMGNDISSESFRSLLTPDFEPERASIRLRSSKRLLLHFLSQQPRLQIYLCCGSLSLGCAEVPLSSLATSSSAVDVDWKPLTVEGTFVLEPLGSSNQTQPRPPPDLQPTVGVAITLRREELALQPKSVGERDLPLQTPPPAAPPPSNPPHSSSPPPPLHPASPPPASPSISVAESLHEEAQQREGGAAGLQPSVQARGGGAAGAAAGGVVSIPPSSHHYCFSLDLLCLGGVTLTSSVTAVLRYWYQFFGSSTPISTSPPVTLQKDTETPLPQAYCSFNYAAAPDQQEETFRRVPLMVELWNCSDGGERLLGLASVRLSGLLIEQKTAVRVAGAGWRRSQQERVPVMSSERPSQQIAELSVCMTLEDLGEINTRELLTHSNQKEVPAKAPLSPSLVPTAAPPATAPVAPSAAPPVAPRSSLEYRTALELELWKEEQENLFDDQLRRKELSHMAALADEWRKRDREREALVKKKEVEFSVLEDQLQRTLVDLEKREKTLRDAELETVRLQEELRSDHQRALRELQENKTRLQQDSDHRVALERHRVELMEDERTRLLQQLSDSENRYKNLEREFQQFRDQQNARPEIRLQADVNLLTLEKVELERKLESCTKSKLHYKQQWGRALKELARFKQREQEAAMQRLKKQQEELEAMRLRYLATQEKEAGLQDRQELESLRNELNRLKEQEERPGPAPCSGSNEEEVQEEVLSRLLEEREALLRTGVYSHSDIIIAELNRQIQEVLGERGAR